MRRSFISASAKLKSYLLNNFLFLIKKKITKNSIDDNQRLQID